MNIKELAEQAGFAVYGWNENEFKKFAALVEAAARADEREEDCVGWFGYDTALRLWFETNKGDDGAIPLYKARGTT